MDLLFSSSVFPGRSGYSFKGLKEEVGQDSRSHGLLLFYSPRSLTFLFSYMFLSGGTGALKQPPPPKDQNLGGFPSPALKPTPPVVISKQLTPSLITRWEVLSWQRVQEILQSALDNSAPKGKPSSPFWFACSNLFSDDSEEV